jgi:hypothetical protein
MGIESEAQIEALIESLGGSACNEKKGFDTFESL